MKLLFYFIFSHLFGFVYFYLLYSYRWILYYLAQGGHIHVLKWAREHGCAWDESTFSAAAKSGNIKLLQWLYDQNCPRSDSWTFWAAAKYGHKHVIRWLLQHEFVWDEKACSAAVAGDNFKLLQWLRGQDCPWDATTTWAAARRGNFDVMTWAREQGCPWDERSCSGAGE